MSHPNLATDEKIVEVGKGKSSLLGSCLASSLLYLHLSKPLIFLLCPCVLLCRHWFVDSERAVLMCAQSLWSHPTLQPVDCSPPDSSVHEILQARILEWVATPSSRGSSWSRHRTRSSCIAGRFFTAEPPGEPKGIVLPLNIYLKL